MTNFESRIALQESRFNLIQQAAENAWNLISTVHSRQLIITRLEVLELNWNKFQMEHESLCQGDNGTLKDQPYMKTKMLERCQEFYIQARASLMSQRDEMDTSRPITGTSLVNSPTVGSSVSHRSALPKITIPQFSGDYQSWISFRDLFSSLISNNHELNNVEKMHYLKTSLTGEAARLISNISISEENFIRAWETLTSRYENRRYLISAQLDKLSNIKPLRHRSSRDLSSFLTNITESLGALRILGCPVHHWEIILLHQFVKLLDTETCEIWENKLGSSMDSPTFAQFEEFLTGRIRTVENLERRSSNSIPSKERSSFVLSRNQPQIKAHISSAPNMEQSNLCIICNMQHRLDKCPSYQNKTRSQRREFVYSQRLCYNCLNNHAVINCPTTRRCFKCGKKHHTSLHTDNVTTHSTPSFAIAAARDSQITTNPTNNSD